MSSPKASGNFWYHKLVGEVTGIGAGLKYAHDYGYADHQILAVILAYVTFNMLGTLGSDYIWRHHQEKIKSLAELTSSKIIVPIKRFIRREPNYVADMMYSEI